MIFDDDYREKELAARGWTALWQRLHIDFSLLIGLLAITVVGLGILYSASGGNAALVLRQAIRIGIAFVVLLVMAQIPCTSLRRYSPWLFGAGLASLVLVLVLGDVGKGAQRWLDLGFVRFQPSEMMKLAVPLLAASYVHDRGLPPKLRETAAILAITAIPAALIGQQPDLGTAVLVAMSGLFVLFLAGLRWSVILLMGAAISAAAPLLWWFMHDYQRRRVLTFLNPEQDPLGAGYHIIQSKIALGSGGLFGKGWLNGSQAHLQFLPERSTDFIFAVYGEEFGLIGLALLLTLYLFVVGRGLSIALRAQDNFERLMAASLSLTFFVYVFVNAGMVTGLLPVVGVPLPLVSYGGTSMVTLMAGFGILMSIQTHKKLIPQ